MKEVSKEDAFSSIMLFEGIDFRMRRSILKAILDFM